jgi:cytoskeletal protein RodZ
LAIRIGVNKRKREKQHMKEIGKILRKAREERHIGIEEVNIKTHIPLKFITALEEGNRAEFPAEVYYTGSLRRYAQFLNLNENELLERYQQTLQQKKVAADEAKKPKRKQVTAYPKIFIGIGVFIVLLLIIYALVRIFTSPQSTPATPAPVMVSSAAAGAAVPAITSGTVSAPATAAPATPSSVPASVPAPAVKAPVPAATVTSPVPTPTAGEGLKLSIRSIKDTWMRISADDAIVFDGIMPAGNRREWTAKRRYYIVFGFLTGVKVSLNGHPIDITKMANTNTNELWLTRDTIRENPRPAAAVPVPGNTTVAPSTAAAGTSAAEQR